MRKSLIFLLLTCLTTVSFTAAQTTPKVQPQIPDLTGTWELVGELPRDVTARYIVVSQNGVEITMEEVFESQTVPGRYRILLFTDKRGEKNELPVRNSSEKIIVDSRTSWNKDKLVRTMTYETPFQSALNSGVVQHREVETYKASKDGTTLVVEVAVSRENPFTSMPSNNFFKRTYRKKT